MATRTKPFDELSFSQQLLAWGRSGSFYPNLVPSPESTQSLRALQKRLQKHMPGSQPVDNLHMTILYAGKAAFDDVERETNYYADLHALFFALLFERPQLARVVDLAPFGAGNKVALRLRLNEELQRTTGPAREIARLLLNRHGVEATGWLMGDVNPHISLLDLPEPVTTELPKLKLPGSVFLEGLAAGSVSTGSADTLEPGLTILPSINPTKWHLGLGPSAMNLLSEE